MGELLRNGEGCKTCPVKNCDTSIYRGSTCAALRHQAGVYHDPQTKFEAIKEKISQMTVEDFCYYFYDFVWDCSACPEYDNWLGSGCSKKCMAYVKWYLELPEDPGVEVSS